MGKFLEALRENKIKTPTTRAWTKERWATDFANAGEPDHSDKMVFNAGLCFGKKLSTYWFEVDALNLSIFDKFDLHSKIALCFIAWSEKAASKPTSGNDEFTGDHAQTAFGDTLNRALQYLGGIAEFGTTPVIDEILYEALKKFNAIYVHEFMWGRVLWSEWQLSEARDEITLSPASPSAEVMLHHEGIAEFLRQIEAQQMNVIYSDEWAAGRHRDAAPPVIKLAKYKVPRASFFVEMRPTDEMPFYLPALLSALPAWLDPMLTSPLSELDNHGLVEVIKVWRLMIDAIREIRKADEIGLIHIDDAVGLASKILNLSKPTARKMVEFLIYDHEEKKGDGIWGAPFVRLTPDILCPVLPSLMHPNIQRMADLWGERCRSQQLLIFRGGLWEQHLRASLINGFKSAFPDADWWVQPTDLKRWGHQLDILARVGKLVLVGETKFAKYPCIPAEFGRFFKEILGYGGMQANVRASDLEKHRKEVAKFTGYRGQPDDLIFQPIIVSPHFLGSGLLFNNVPCISADELLHFFTSETLPLGGMQPESGVGELPFRRPGEPLDTAFLRHLMNPPQMFLYSRVVKTTVHRYAVPEASTQAINWPEGKVEVPSDEAGYTSFAKEAEARWAAEVLG